MGVAHALRVAVSPAEARCATRGKARPRAWLLCLGGLLAFAPGCTNRYAPECGSTRCTEQRCCTLCGGQQVCMDECPVITSCEQPEDGGATPDGRVTQDAELPSVDAAAAVDAAPLDAGVMDSPDAGLPDAGLDAGLPDAGLPDAGLPDAGSACTAPELCDGVDDDCDGAIDEGGACPCPVVQRSGGAYLFCDDRLTWRDARDACAALGYQLVRVGGASEDAFVFEQIDTRGFADTWIGANDRDREMQWVWLDGTPVRYEHWDWGEPNDGATGGEDCAVIMTSFGRASEWDDRSCSSRARPYVCEAR